MVGLSQVVKGLHGHQDQRQHRQRQLHSLRSKLAPRKCLLPPRRGCPPAKTPHLPQRHQVKHRAGQREHQHRNSHRINMNSLAATFITPTAAPNAAAPSSRRSPLNATKMVHTLCTIARKRLDQPIHLNRDAVCAALVSGVPAGASTDSSIASLLVRLVTELSLPFPPAPRNPGKQAESDSCVTSKRSAAPSFPASRSATFGLRLAESCPLQADTACAFSGRAPSCARSSLSKRFPPRNIYPASLHAQRSMCRSLRSMKMPGWFPGQTPPRPLLLPYWAWRSPFRSPHPPRPSFCCRKRRRAGGFSCPSRVPTAPCTEPAASDAAPSFSARQSAAARWYLPRLRTRCPFRRPQQTPACRPPQTCSRPFHPPHPSRWHPCCGR